MNGVPLNGRTQIRGKPIYLQCRCCHPTFFFFFLQLFFYTNIKLHNHFSVYCRITLFESFRADSIYSYKYKEFPVPICFALFFFCVLYYRSVITRGDLFCTINIVVEFSPPQYTDFNRSCFPFIRVSRYDSKTINYF